LQLRLILRPPVGANPSRPTVPVEETPPSTLDGSSFKVVGVAGEILSVAPADKPLAEAVTLAVVVALTPDVVQ